MDENKNQIQTISQCKREMNLEIPAEEAAAEFQKALSQFQSRVKIKGFRPGKAPADLVKSMYMADIKEAVVNALAPDAINRTLRSAGIVPVASPVVSQLDFEEGGPLMIKADFEVWPEFDLPDYKKIRIKSKKSQVTEDHVSQALEDLRERTARVEPIEERGIEKDDFVMIELKGHDTGSNKMLPTEKLYVMADHPDNEKNLNQALKGMLTNEEKKFSVEYPADHSNKRLAGKNILYRIKVLSIKQKVLPELNDDFAREVGKFETLDELKQQITKELTEAGEKNTEHELTEETIRQISDQIEMELPEIILEQETLVLLRRMLSARQRTGVSREEADQMQKAARSQAENRIKNHLILTRIADTENIDVSEEELDAELESLAEANQMPLPRVKESARREGRLDELKSNLRLRKTVDFLRDNAIIGK